MQVKSHTLSYDNYIFDLYGTLLENHTNEVKISLFRNLSNYMTLTGVPYMPNELKAAYKRLYKTTEDFFYKAEKLSNPSVTKAEIEIDIRHVIRGLYREKGVQADSRTITYWALLFRALSTEYVRPIENAMEVLDFLKDNGKGVYLLSNAQRYFTMPEIKACGLYDKFDRIFISSDIGFKKPSADYYNYFFEKTGLSKENSVMIGNEFISDCLGATKAGLSCIYIPDSANSKEKVELPDNAVKVKSIKDILKI